MYGIRVVKILMIFSFIKNVPLSYILCVCYTVASKEHLMGPFCLSVRRVFRLRLFCHLSVVLQITCSVTQDEHKRTLCFKIYTENKCCMLRISHLQQSEFSTHLKRLIPNFVQIDVSYGSYDSLPQLWQWLWQRLGGSTWNCVWNACCVSTRGCEVLSMPHSFSV